MAAGNATLTTLQQMLKTKYDQKKLNVMTYADDPLLGLLRKDQKFGGNNARITLRYGAPQGGSITFTNAQANVTSSNDAGFLLTRAHDYHTSGIDAEALLAGEGDENSLMNTLKGEMEGGTRMIKRSLEIGVYGNGGAARGQLDGTTAVASAGPFTLVDISQIVNFEVDMKIMTSAADGTSGAIRGGTAATIAGIDADLGQITFGAALNATVTAPGTTDYLFRDGDFGQHIKGLAAWCPTTAPSATLFFGVNRTAHVTRLGGCRYTGGGAPKEITVQKAAARLGREGGKPDVLLMNFEEWADLAISLQSKVVYDIAKSQDGLFGFEALKMVGPKGVMKVVGSINVPRGHFYMLQLDTWVLKSLKGAPHVDDTDGLQMLRQGTADGYSWRLRYYAQIGCEAPGFNLHGTW